MTTNPSPRTVPLAKRISRFLHRYAYGILAVTLAASILFWQAWEHPRHLSEKSFFYLKPIPLSTTPVTLHPELRTVRAVVEDLARQCHATLDYQEKVLEGFGIHDKTELQLQNPPTAPVSLLTALSLIQEALQETEPGAAQFEIEPNRIVFTAGNALRSEAHTTRVIYPIDDLLSLRSPYEHADAVEELKKDLITLIETNIQPDNWTDNGGALATFQINNSDLIIQATPAMHYMIQQLLNMLRAPRQTNFLK